MAPVNAAEQRRMEAGHEIDLKWLTSFVVVTEKSCSPSSRLRSRLRIPRPAEREPGPDLGRLPGGHYVDPRGTRLERRGDLQLQRDLAVVTQRPRPPRVGGVPAVGAVADPQSGQGPDSPVVSPVVLHRDAACVQVQDGAALALVQAEDGDPGTV